MTPGTNMSLNLSVQKIKRAVLYVGPCFHGCHWHREKSTVWSLLFPSGRSADWKTWRKKGELELLTRFPRDTRAYFLLKFTAP